MRLYVYVLQAKDLLVRDSYVKVQVGKNKSKTRILKNNANPIWNEEFVFRIQDVEDEEVLVSVLNRDDDSGFLHSSGDSMGRVRIPVSSVAAEDNQVLPPTWFSLEQPNKTGKFTNKDCGKILLTISLRGKGHDASSNRILYPHSYVNAEDSEEFIGPCVLSHEVFQSKAPSAMIADGKHFMKTIASRLEKIFNKNEEASRIGDSSDVSSVPSDYEDCVEEHPSSLSFKEAIEMLQSRDDDKEVPENLQGGILLDQVYVVSPYDLNTFLFAPDSQFRRDLAELQGTKDLQEGLWQWKSGDISCLTRVVTYLNAATKLVKAVTATEQQTYIKANGREFAIMVNVSTPEVPFGNTFNIELLYKMIPGLELSSGEESCRLTISWAIKFHQSTMMKGMIEGGARQGVKESFDQFANLLAQNLKTLDSTDVSEKDHVLATLETEHQSNWKLATEYFWNFTVVSATFMVLYVLWHILLSESSKVQGLEFYGFDLPDSFGELITCAILVIQVERAYNMVSHFVQARLQRGNDHGVKSQGDGWVLTVALIEGVNLAALESTGFSDPYVVFTCNGKTRTSSVKLQTCDPQWNDVLEFDAMEEPPSVLDVEVFDFDGPFDRATSLGHAEINFLKHTSTELADMLVSLEGKLAQSSQSKLHLRIFLDNNKGVETIKEYLTKMEKEVGKKLNLRSPHKNSTFQKLFALPTEEFLIGDFTCQLKRKLPLQGRLFLSARIVGFHANLFGYKTKFFLLWEDVNDIQLLPPSLASVGSPSLVIILRKGRGLDARHGAKSQDEEGRLRFYFQSFVSFNVASRTIMALWRTRTLTPDQKAQITEEQQDQEETSVLEDTGSILHVEDSKMSRVYATELPISIDLVMEMFGGGKLEYKIMEKSGCLNYATSLWEPVRPGVFERRLSYRFSRLVSIFGGEVTCTQEKSPLANGEGWIVNEVMTLHDVPFGDHFRLCHISCIKKNSHKYRRHSGKPAIALGEAEMDPNPKSFPILSYVMARLPTFGPKSTTVEYDIEQPHPSSSSSGRQAQLQPQTQTQILVDQMPHLSDPNLISSMNRAISDVYQTRSVLQTLGPRPDHEAVDNAKAKISEIEASLSKSLEDLVLSPRPADVDRFQWRALLAEKEKECRDKAEKEKTIYRSILQLEEMHDSYEKMLKEAEARLVKMYERADNQEGSDALPAEIDQVNEEIVEVLQEASGKSLESVDLSGRRLKILPEAFGRIPGLRVLNLSSNQLEVIPDSIAGLKDLEELNLSSNLLESLPDSIGLLQNLKILDVAGNKLTALPDSVCHCRSLVELDVSFNRLTYLPTNIGYELVNLQKLSISLNKIRSLPTSVGEMKSLRYLDAHFNEIHSLPLSIGKLTNLEILNLSSNFTDLEELPETFGELINLKELDLSNNQIHALPDTFGRLDNLTKLNLEQNPLLIPPPEIVKEGVEAIKDYMAKRWLDLLVEEERKCMLEENEQAQTGWLTRSTSWLKSYASGVSGYIGAGKPSDPCLDQQF
ncbi:hypothetical protein Q3G72_029097 [Acer saccharum]|nr:hypothetical protein Q3G72_029097 [Acer saccharum]